MVPRLLATARAMRSRTCADVIQPCHEEPFRILNARELEREQNIPALSINLISFQVSCFQNAELKKLFLRTGALSIQAS